MSLGPEPGQTRGSRPPQQETRFDFGVTVPSWPGLSRPSWHSAAIDGRDKPAMTVKVVSSKASRVTAGMNPE
jgi:hypothetical protein